MYIELTDHLRCPEEHDEAYLVLLPGEMDGRDVRTGELGCPVCGRTFAVRDGVLDLGGATPAAPTALTADAITALLGLNGPGGWYVVVGGPAALWRELLERNPGVAPVAVNPPAGLAGEYPLSIVRAGRIPVKSRTMRGVVLGPGYAADPAWRAEAVRVTLPGLRVVGEGGEPAAGLELLASAEGVWVGAKTNR